MSNGKRTGGDRLSESPSVVGETFKFELLNNEGQDLVSLRHSLVGLQLRVLKLYEEQKGEQSAEEVVPPSLLLVSDRLLHENSGRKPEKVFLGWFASFACLGGIVGTLLSNRYAGAFEWNKDSFL